MSTLTTLARSILLGILFKTSGVNNATLGLGMVLDVEGTRVVGEEGGVLEQARRRLRHLDLLGQRVLRGRLTPRGLDVRRDALYQPLNERKNQNAFIASSGSCFQRRLHCMAIEQPHQTYVSKAAPLREHIVDGVSGNPEHGGERHAEADGVHVERVLDVLAVLERLPHEQVGQEDGLRKGVEAPNRSWIKHSYDAEQSASCPSLQSDKLIVRQVH